MLPLASILVFKTCHLIIAFWTTKFSYLYYEFSDEKLKLSIISTISAFACLRVINYKLRHRLYQDLSPSWTHYVIAVGRPLVALSIGYGFWSSLHFGLLSLWSFQKQRGLLLPLTHMLLYMTFPKRFTGDLSQGFCSLHC